MMMLNDSIEGNGKNLILEARKKSFETGKKVSVSVPTNIKYLGEKLWFWIEFEGPKFT